MTCAAVSNAYGHAVDTNVLVALWNPDDFLNTAARTALDAGVARGELVICGPVYAELIAFPTRSESFLDEFLVDTGIRVDWDVSESIWRLAGRAYKTVFCSPTNSGGRALGEFSRIF